MKKQYLIRTLILAGSLLLQLSTLCFHSRGAAGDVDLSFDPGFGVNGPVNAVVVQPDGKVLIGGKFTIVKGLARTNLARLNADGSGDPTFNPGIAYDLVSSLALQSDGKVLVGGQFVHYECDEFGCFDRFDSIVTRLNASGSLDGSFNPATGAGGSPYGVSSVVVQSDGKVLIGGGFTAVNGTNRISIARLNANGSLDSSFDTGAEVIISYFRDYPVAVALQPDGKVLVGSVASIVNGTNRSGIVRLNANGSLDSSFDPAGNFYRASSVALQPDGKVLLGGGFGIARLNANGSLDGSFNSAPGGGGYFSRVGSIVVQSDGKVLIGGLFTAVNGTNRNSIARLNADGSLDDSFNPGTGVYGAVYSVALQPDGKLLIGGSFLAVNGTNRSRIARLNADGGLDGSFHPGIGLEIPISTLVVQPDGKVLVGDPFTFISGTNRYGIARLNADGSLDSTFISHRFVAELDHPDNSDGYITVLAVTVQSDGKVLVGGFSYSGTCGDGSCIPSSSWFVTRLNPDGRRDTNFAQAGGGLIFYNESHETVRALAVQPDGKIVVGGDFTDFNGAPRNGIARLNSNGSLDTSFNASIGVRPGNPHEVNSVVVQADGKVLIGGSFFAVNGTNRSNIARLNSNGSLDSSFNPPVGGYPLALQPDGKILLGGYARLNADGSLDASFNQGPASAWGGEIRSIALQPDGNILIGGSFTTVKGVWRPFVARLYGDPAPALNIARSNAFMIVSWPVTGLNFQLQETTDLSLPNSWSPVAQPAVTNAGQISATVPTIVGRRFFRLKSQ